MLMTEFFQHYWYLLGQTKSDIGPPPPPRGFAQFVKLEREAMQSAECRRYWEESSPAVLPRTPRFHRQQTGVTDAAPRRTVMRRIAISAATIAGLNKVAQAANAPLKTVLLSAHLRVLGLLSGKPRSSAVSCGTVGRRSKTATAWWACS